MHTIPRPLPTSSSVRGLCAPEVLLFDWHGTLVDTLDAMYSAVQDMLAQLDGLQLTAHLVRASECKTPQDARLVDYVRQYRRLHPKVVKARQLSRTDIFEILFGHDDAGKAIAHAAYNRCYREHYGEVRELAAGQCAMLQGWRRRGIRLGIVSNRDREFLQDELARVDAGRWQGLFDVIVCGGDTTRRKPAPDALQSALLALGAKPGPHCWYVGDAATDVSAARRAGVTSAFFNSPGWTLPWLTRYFAADADRPDTPDVVVENFRDLDRLVRRLSLAEAPPVRRARIPTTAIHHALKPRILLAAHGATSA